MGESWAHHQLAAHEYGALAAFLEEFAAGELAEHADLARSWVGARMGGYRIGGRLEGTCALEVRDLADGALHEVLDLGAISVAGPDRTVIGRLVPSGMRPQLMFDTVPLPVSEELAHAVARGSAEGGDWAEVVAIAIDEDGLDPDDLFREDYELMSDVPSLDLVAFGTRATDLARVMSQLRNGRDEVGRAAFRILRSASEGSLEPDAAPYVAAAVLNVHAYEQAPRRILLPGQRRQWLHWAELVPDPARGRLLRFAEATAEAA